MKLYHYDTLIWHYNTLICHSDMTLWLWHYIIMTLYHYNTHYTHYNNLICHSDMTLWHSDISLWYDIMTLSTDLTMSLILLWVIQPATAQFPPILSRWALISAHRISRYFSITDQLAEVSSPSTNRSKAVWISLQFSFLSRLPSPTSGLCLPWAIVGLPTSLGMKGFLSPKKQSAS